MSGNRVFMNRPRPHDPDSVRVFRLMNLLGDARPLKGTNLEWVYQPVCRHCGERRGVHWAPSAFCSIDDDSDGARYEALET